MNWMTRVEKRNSRLICLGDLSSQRNSSLSSAAGDEDVKMKSASAASALQPHQPPPSSAPASAPVAPVRRLSPTDVAAKGTDGYRRRCGDLFLSSLCAPQTTSDITTSLSSPPSDSSPAQHHHQYQQHQHQQLGKLKRFLATLERLGADISPVIGHKVNSLVRALIDNAISVEDFHDQLHRTTNFPLRPFVVPFLKSNLPILQKEVQSRLTELPPLSLRPCLDQQHHQSGNEPTILRGADCHIGAAQTKSPTPPDDGAQNNKRPAHDFNYKKTPENRARMNGGATSPAAKRMRTCSPARQSNAHSLDGASDGYSADGASGSHLDTLPYKASHELNAIASLGSTNPAWLSMQCLDRDQEHSNDMDRFFSGCSRKASVDPSDEDWNYAENILQCIVGLAERCQRALQVLQERATQRNKDSLVPKNNWTVPLSSLSSCHSLSSSSSSFDGTLMNGAVKKKQVSAESAKAEVQQKETHRLDLRGCAVNVVKRQAMVELQKAVATAEAKASEVLAFDRLKMDRTLDEVRERTRAEVAALLNRQVDCNESCWNCGRLASETCSGCNRARYCGIFCQHRHWEIHHRVCGKAFPSSCKSPPTRSEPRKHLSYEGGASSPSHAHSETTINEDGRGRQMKDVTPSFQPLSEPRRRLQATTALCQFQTQLIVNVKQETI